MHVASAPDNELRRAQDQKSIADLCSTRLSRQKSFKTKEDSESVEESAK